MDNYSALYWLTRLDALDTFFGVIWGLGITMVVVLLIIYLCLLDYDGNDDDFKLVLKRIRRSIFWISLTCFIFGLIDTLTPTRDEAIFIMAGGKTLDFVQADTSIQNIPGQTTAIISKFFEQQLEEMNKETEESTPPRGEGDK